jgi:DNA-binding transcriptional LysR family regulator
MNIEHIDTFLDLVATRSFHRTAERLDLSQSTVSARVRALETALGARLFVRGRGGAMLTPEGQRFERYAVNLRMGWNQARQDLAMPTGFEGRLHVGIQSQLADRLIDSWARELRRALPETALDAAADYSPAMMEQLVSGNLDLAVLYDPVHRPDLHVDWVFDEAFSMVATYPTAFDAVATDDYIRIWESPHFQARHAERLPHLQRPTVSVPTGAMALTCLRRLGGVAYLPQRLAGEVTASGELYAVTGAPVLEQPVYVAYHARIRRQPRVATAIELVRAIDINTAPHQAGEVRS